MCAAPMEVVEDYKAPEIDENLYSRQLGVFGQQTMGKLVRMNVLIVGMKGIGVETAKNIILAGPRSVTLYDPEVVAIADLGTNFYLTAADVGQPRAEASYKQLAELNSYVDVKVHAGELNDAFLKGFNVVVFTRGDRETLVKFDELCRSNGIVFIYAENQGVTVSVFSDFGDHFEVLDQTGEPPIQKVIVEVRVDTEHNNRIVCETDGRHKLPSGEEVKIDEVVGSPELQAALNDQQFEIEAIKYNSFVLVKKRERNADGKTELKDFSFDATKFSYVSGGQCIQEKVPKSFKFKSLKDTLTNPVAPGEYSLPVTDYGKFGHPEQLHFALLAVWEFQAKNNGELPRLHSKDDADKCIAIAKEILEEYKKQPEGTHILVEEIDEKFVRQRCLYARSELLGHTACFGGVVAQEIVKYTGKYTPIRQWLHLDTLELVEDEVRADAAPQNSRYDHQLSIFGAAIQDKLLTSKFFVVGAGALGCEYLKSCALMGIGCKSPGEVHVTDMDTIEVSNLNRQFLFRPEHVGKEKSTCAAHAAKTMNPDLNIHSYLIRVGPDTEDQFDDTFWDKLDGVVNALDNIIARQYIDGKCVIHEKPLLESGTLGTKANAQVVLPHKTQTYSESADPEEDAIPMCTLRNFPHLIDHCIEWARAEFSTHFENGPQEVNSFLKDPKKYFEQVSKEGNAVVQLEKLTAARKWIDHRKSATFETCLKMGYDNFHKQYRDRIADLIRAFPEDARVTKDGVDKGPFWSGSKRFPAAATFTIDDESHLQYVWQAANVFAFVLGLPEEQDREKVCSILATFAPPEYVPSNKKIEDLEEEVAEDDDGEEKEDTEMTDAGDDDVAKLEEIKKYLLSLDLTGYKPVEVVEFEKDDDSNHHIDFITACANLRATNYRIKTASRHKCKMIAGKIMPALATTTAMITGLIALELYKLTCGFNFEKHRDAFINLGISQILFVEPTEPKTTKSVEMDPATYMPIKAVPEGFSRWHKVVVQGKRDTTVEEFIALLKEAHHGAESGLVFKYGISDKDIETGNANPIYNANQYLAPAFVEENKKVLKRPLVDVYIEKYGPLAAEGRRYLMLDVQCEVDGDTALIPVILFKF